MSNFVKVTNSALYEDKEGNIVLHGVLEFDTLKYLRVDKYQREVLAKSGSGGRSTSKIKKAIVAGNVFPSIELGMRGDDFTTSGKAVILRDPVYIIDGLQRVSAMLDYLDEQGGDVNGTKPLSATIFFDSTAAKERQRFTLVNTSRIPVSPNVLLRNAKEEHPGIAALYGLTTNEVGFCLNGRVCWDQRMKQEHILRAAALVRVALQLHRAVHDRVMASLPGGKVGNSAATGREALISMQFGLDRAPILLDRIVKAIGLTTMRNNVRMFFEHIDECYGIKNIEYGEAQGHLKGNFLSSICALYSRNPGLWSADQKTLHVSKEVLSRLKTFKVNDPEIRRLSASGTMAIPILYNQYLLQHLNYKKSKNRFV